MKPIIIFEDDSNKDDKLYTVAEVQKSKEISTVENGLAIYEKQADELSVTSQVDYNAASDFCKNIKEAHKRIENKRKFFGNPYHEAKKAIDKLFKGKIESLSKIEKTVKDKMLTWHNAQLLAAAEEKKRIEKENFEKLKSTKDGEMPPVMTPTTLKVDQTSRGESSTSTVKMLKKWRISDLGAIPREFMCVDDKKVTAAVKSGLEVPGIDVYEESSLAIR